MPELQKQCTTFCLSISALQLQCMGMNRHLIAGPLADDTKDGQLKNKDMPEANMSKAWRNLGMQSIIVKY